MLGIAQYLESLREKLLAGWIPTSIDTINMASWFDSVGISLKHDDELKQLVYSAAKAFNGLTHGSIG